MKTIITSFYVLMIIGGCSENRTDSTANMKQSLTINDTIKYRTAINECSEIFGEYSFPNSQARPKGFDLSSHLDSIEQRRKQISKIFYSQKGITILRTFMENETDYVNLIGMLKICYESKLPEGKAILKEYITCCKTAKGRFNEQDCLIVSDFAKRYYNKFEN